LHGALPVSKPPQSIVLYPVNYTDINESASILKPGGLASRADAGVQFGYEVSLAADAVTSAVFLPRFAGPD
jgi:hypothetical protein